MKKNELAESTVLSSTIGLHDLYSLIPTVQVPPEEKVDRWAPAAADRPAAAVGTAVGAAAEPTRAAARTLQRGRRPQPVPEGPGGNDVTGGRQGERHDPVPPSWVDGGHFRSTVVHCTPFSSTVYPFQAVQLYSNVHNRALQYTTMQLYILNNTVKKTILYTTAKFNIIYSTNTQ